MTIIRFAETGWRGGLLRKEAKRLQIDDFPYRDASRVVDFSGPSPADGKIASLQKPRVTKGQLVVRAAYWPAPRWRVRMLEAHSKKRGVKEAETLFPMLMAEHPGKLETRRCGTRARRNNRGHANARKEAETHSVGQ